METLDITIPTAYSQLTDRKALRIIRLIDTPPCDTIVTKLTALRILTGIRFLGVTKTHDSPEQRYLFRFPGRRHLILDAGEVVVIMRELEWIFQPLPNPWRPSRIAGRKTKEPTLLTLPFEQYLALENLWAGFLHITAHAGDTDAALGILRRILDIVTEPHGCGAKIADGFRFGRGAKKAARLAPGRPLIMWITSVKDNNQKMFPTFYTAMDSTESLMPHTAASISPQRLRDTMNAQIRALTKGDITKEEQILAMPTERALTELDALAREYRELKEKTKK